MQDLDALAAGFGDASRSIGGFWLGEEICRVQGTRLGTGAVARAERMADVLSIESSDVRIIQDLGPDCAKVRRIIRRLAR